MMSFSVLIRCLLSVGLVPWYAGSSPIVGFGPTRIDLGLLSIGIPSDPVSSITNSTKCMGPLGCFSTDGPFYDPVRRPVSLLPYDRSIMDVRFLLYTRRNPDNAEILSEKKSESLQQSNFNADKETKIIVHGFLDNVAFANWIQDTKNLLLLRDDYNVIVVDWGRANKFPYMQAVANTRVVGAEIALLVKRLQDVRNADPKKMHILGHSLGAQVAGYAGERIPNLGRITGLDPAGPYYTGTHPSVRLDPTDANFVDVIHSDASTSIATGLGTVNSVGHVDFFPNNGNNQPGCDAPILGIVNSVERMLSEGIPEGIRHSIICDHQRAADLFTASIMPDRCMPVALSCPDWDNFINGKCGDCEDDGSRCAVMGIDSLEYYKRNPKHRRFYLRTSGEYPFCLYQYQVTVVMGDNREARKVRGRANVMIKGTKANLRARLSKSGSETFKPGSYHTYLIASKRDIGDINSADFKWRANNGGGDDADLYLRLVRISPLAMPTRQGKKLNARTLCGKGETPIKSGQTARLSANENC